MAKHRRLSIRRKSSDPPLFLHLPSNQKIVIGNGAEKRGLIAAVWGSQTAKTQVARYGNGFIFDMNRLGW